VDDPADPPRLVYSEGLLGRSSRDGYVRLYTTRVLDEYYDFPEECVRGVFALPREERRPYGATAIWIEPAKAVNNTIYRRQQDVPEEPVAPGVLARDWQAAIRGPAPQPGERRPPGGGWPGGSGPLYPP
jgi:hypothetical protein